MTDQNTEHISFERLDELMRVTDPKGWVSLIGLFILILMGVIWLFYGSIYKKITGTGMLLNIGGIQSVTSNITGKIIKFDTKIADYVKEGQPIIYIEQTSFLTEIEDLKQKIKERIITNQEKEIVREKLKVKYQEEIVALHEKRVSQEKLLHSGLVIEKDALETREKLTEMEKEYENLNMDKLNDQFSLNALNRELASLQNKYEQNSIITSPHAGTVFELDKTVGDFISPGTTLMKIESQTNIAKRLQGIIYISAFDGNSVQVGMQVSIIPSTIKPEEYGSLIGVVTYISSYPATSNGMMRILNNEELVKQILSKEAKVEVHVDLIPDPSTVSKYKWTSKDGPPIKVQSGTLCDAKITIKEKKPISYILPKAKELLGIE